MYGVVFYGFETLKQIMKDKLNRLDAILNELQMDEYLNEDSLPKIGEARGLVNELVKNCSIPNVSQQRELLKGFLEKVVEETEVGDLTWQTRDEAKELLKLFNCG